MLNYQKIDFLAEINATNALKRELSYQEKDQIPLFSLKHAKQILEILIKEKMFAKTDTSFDRLVAFGDQELLENFLQTYYLESPKQQLFFLNDERFQKKLLRKNELTAEVQNALLSLNNRELLEIYISHYQFKIPQAKEFLKIADDALLAKYISRNHYTWNPLKTGPWGYTHFDSKIAELLKMVEETVFAKENPLAVIEFCKCLTISEEKHVSKLLTPENEEALLTYLKNYNSNRYTSLRWLANTKDRRVLEYCVLKNNFDLSSDVETKLFEFEDSEKWLQRYLEYTTLSPQNELRLLAPKYAELFENCVKNGKLRSEQVQLELFSEKYRPLLSDYIKKYSLHPLTEAKLFELDDDNELLKLYIEKRGKLSTEGEKLLFEGNNRELKLYYLKRIGQDK